MNLKPFWGVLLGAAMSPAAFAGTFDLSLSAEDGGRWYEYYSGAYAELGADWGIIDNPSSAEDGLPADGFYAIGTGEKIGGGAIVFPAQGNFLNVGSLSFDDTTGVVDGLTLDFDNYIADDDTITNAGYTTSVSNIVGSVMMGDGGVSAIDLTADITFTYDSAYGLADYTGTFAISGDSFALLVDETKSIAGLDFRYAWDVEGGVQNLSPVPEASTYAMLMAGLGVVGAIARRRRRK